MIELFYFIAVAIPVTLSAIGAGIGQGLIGKKALKAIHEQPTSTNSISKVCIIGIALTETTSILGAVVSIMLLVDRTPIQNYYYATFGAFGIALAMGISGFCVGIASSLPAQAACLSIARQPFMHTKILNLMLITQTLIMTPNIFGFIISLLIKSNLAATQTLETAMQLFASGFSIGVGCIGPAIGLSLFAYAACTAIGVNKNSFSKIVPFTFISEAIIETPLIFALLVSLFIITTNMDGVSFLKAFSMLCAAICIGICTISTGINAGRIGSESCKQIALNLNQYSALSKTTMLALAMLDTFAIYGLLVSMMLLFFVVT